MMARVRVKRFLIGIAVILAHNLFPATILEEPEHIAAADTLVLEPVIISSGQELATAFKKRPHPLLFAFRKKRDKNKKAVAAVLAFPFPFGIVGLHRIYLGCSPYVPVVYIATAGGVLGILPFIDFCVLLLDKDLEHYINNKKVFMWVN